MTGRLLEFSKEPVKYKIFLIFIVALLLRLYGLNWDQNQHLHPDERFLTMVATDIKLPDSLMQYFNTSASPLNPGNYPNYQFFVYGTFPLFLAKILAHIFNQDNYSQVVFWGRGLSALFDSLVVILLYFLSRKKLLPSLLYAFTVLPLQLSHFFAVDTFLNFFILGTFTLLTYNLFIPAAIAFGLALACKISALYFLPIIFLFLIKKPQKIFYFILTFITFRIFQPYAFTGLFQINPLFISNLKTLNSYNNPDIWYPPAVQWISKIPLLFSFQNIVLWGVGLPLVSIFIFSLFKIKKIKLNFIVIISLIWILFLYLYQGSQFVHTMRYFLLIYPFICLLAGYLLINFSKKAIYIFVICHLSFGFLFLNIYSRPHSRVQASDWISLHIPSGSTISSEYWDDALPLGYSGYQNISLPFYDPDTPDKWEKINNSLSQIDYLIMSSNRLWGSIPRVPDKYPVTAKFYQDLFAQNLNFKKLIEINSYPGLSLSFLKNCYYLGPTNFPGIENHWFAIDSQCRYPGIYLRDDTAEEAFTVYDHPKVLIFQQKN